MLENFIYAKRKDLFTAELDAGNILNEAVVFIEDTKEIWNHGTYFDCSTPNLHGIQGKLFVFDRNSIDSNTGIVKQDVYTQLMEAIEDNWHVMIDLEGVIQEYNSNAWASPVTAIAQTDGNDIIMYVQPLGVYSNRIYNHTFKFTIYGNNRQLQSEVLYETGKVVCLDVNNFTEEDYIAALVSPIGTPVFISDGRDNVSIRPDGIKWQGMITSLYSNSQTSYTLRVYQHKSDEDGDVTIKVANATLNASGSLIITELGEHKLLINGDGTKYLSDNGNYNKIKTSELENDLPFVVDDASNPLNNRVTNLENNKADKTAIPTKVSQLENDVPYVVDNTLPENGLYIYDINGNFTLPENWNTANNNKAVGVAIITDNCRFVVAKEDIGKKPWGGYGVDISTLTNYTSSNSAATDFDGVGNTSKIIEAIGNTNDGYRDGTAAGDCAAYTFPNGKTGYLGAAGEWQVARQNKEDLNSALTLIGGTTMTEGAYLTSTESSSNDVWTQWFVSYSALGNNLKRNGSRYVRAFLALEEPKSIKDRLDNIENNYVTTNTEQIISARKRFTGRVDAYNSLHIRESNIDASYSGLVHSYDSTKSAFKSSVNHYAGAPSGLTPKSYVIGNYTGGGIDIANGYSTNADNPVSCGGNISLVCYDKENEKTASICIHNRFSDQNSTENNPLENKVITLCLSSDTEYHSLLTEAYPGVEMLSDNFLLGSIEDNWASVTGAFFQWIKGENRLNICGMGYDSGQDKPVTRDVNAVSINNNPIVTESSIATTTVANLPINKSLIIATLSASASFNLASVPNAGREIHVLVNNNGTSEITITLPTASPYIPVNGDHTTVPVGGYAEINAVSDGTKIYLRAL